MTGNVSDPFCEIFMQDFRNNSHTTVAEFKVPLERAHCSRFLVVIGVVRSAWGERSW
jgi:hypothetical protein